MSPPPLRYKKCIVSKTNLRRSSRMQFFIVWMVCLLHLSALSVTYHGQSILISSKRSLMAAKAYSLVNLTTPFPSTGCIVSPAQGSNTFSAGEGSGLVHKANNGPGYRTWVRSWMVGRVMVRALFWCWRLKTRVDYVDSYM